MVAPVPATLVCVRHVDGDEVTQSLLTAMNATGRAYMSHTVLDDRYLIRVSVGSTLTEERHLDDLWDLFDREAPRLRVGG